MRPRFFNSRMAAEMVACAVLGLGAITGPVSVSVSARQYEPVRLVINDAANAQKAIELSALTLRDSFASYEYEYYETSDDPSTPRVTSTPRPAGPITGGHAQPRVWKPP